jgi:hypothetical protein
VKACSGGAGDNILKFKRFAVGALMLALPVATFCAYVEPARAVTITGSPTPLDFGPVALGDFATLPLDITVIPGAGETVTFFDYPPFTNDPPNFVHVAVSVDNASPHAHILSHSFRTAPT